MAMIVMSIIREALGVVDALMINSSYGTFP